VAWQETSDAGATPATAQRVTGTSSSEVVSIAGTLGGETADLFVVFIPDPAQFSATTVNSATTFDTQLSLYTGRGEAVAFNDDDPNPNSGLRSTLPATDPEAEPPAPGPSRPGLYLIGIAPFNSPPLNASGEPIFASGGFTEVRGPNPGVTDIVLDAFTPTLTNAAYRIDLTGARPVDARVYVDASVAQPGFGGTWDTAFASLAEAIGTARDGDEVWVAQGTYTPGADRADAFVLRDDVTLLGGFEGGESSAAQRDPAGNPTVLSGDLLGDDVPGQDATLSDNAFHVVDATDAAPSAVLDGFVLEGGNADAGGDDAKGGGLFAEDGSPTLRRLVLRRNRARFDGGGLFVEDGTPILDDVRFEANRARNGGGAFLEGSIVAAEALTFAANTATRDGGGLYLDESDVTLPASGPTLTFTQNDAERGGGLFARRVSGDLPRLTLAANTAGTDGGGLYLDESSPRLDALAAFGNEAASRGGGLFAGSNSDPVIVYGRFSGNRARASGGGVHASFLSNPRLAHATLASNTAGLAGAGLSASDNSAPVLANSVVWGNRTDDGAPSALDADATSTFDVQHAVVEGGFAGGTVVIDADPRFADADGPDDAPGTPDDDLRLTLGSSAIETGANGLDLDGPTGPETTTAADLATDLDGQPRLFRAAFAGAAVDLGPYEFQAVQATVAAPTVDGATGFFDLGATGLTANLTRNASPAGVLQAQIIDRRALGSGVPPNTPPFHWQLRAPGFTDSLAYNLTFDLSGVPAVTNPDELMAYASDVAINPGGFFPPTTTWTDLSTLPGVEVTIDVPSARLTVTGLTGNPGPSPFRSFTIGGGNNPLPVELTAFAATPDGDDAVRLVWATASETQNAGFAVEHRAPTADAFAEVAFVDGAGTTTASQRYALRVPGLGAGTHRFRLRQVDFDGTATPSPEVEARLVLDAPAALSAFPSPFRQRASVVAAVREAQRVTVTVHDLLGRTVATLHDGPLGASEPRTLTLDGRGLASGVYLVRLVGTRGAAATRRVVRVR
jgi:hypothetical protein